jgi:hypothetical protein
MRLDVDLLANIIARHCLALLTAKLTDVVKIRMDLRGPWKDGVGQASTMLIRCNVNDGVNKPVLLCDVAGQIRPIFIEDMTHPTANRC